MQEDVECNGNLIKLLLKKQMVRREPTTVSCVDLVKAAVAEIALMQRESH